MLEQLYPLRLIEKNAVFAFIIGVSFAIIGVGLSVFLFPEDPAIVAVAFIALMSYPMINGLMKQEERRESEKEESTVLLFFKDHKDVFVVYLLYFVGVLLVFSLFALVLPELATNHIFENQLNIHNGVGRAYIHTGLLGSLLGNNAIVLMVIFFTAFFIGDGGVFLITWNASVWGTIFGHVSRTAAGSAGENAFSYYVVVILIVLPHVLLEAVSYIASATTGGVISKAVVREKVRSQRFKYVVVNTAIGLLFAAAIMFLGALIETYVLGNVEAYRTIIQQSLGA